MAAGGPGGSRRKSAFNLEEEDELTHLGRSLANDEDPSAGAGLADQQDAFQLSLKRGPREHSDDEDQEVCCILSCVSVLRDSQMGLTGTAQKVAS